MSFVDITRVGSIVQDFTNKRIEIMNKEGYSVWQQKYTNEQTFNRAWNEISKKFSEEVKRRGSLQSEVLK
jgi:hypothetical protein